ncbi:STE3-domain-containing protein [Peniophora sp. CONT]|nr:STE3-domain-containing protein [Peniophora sp. CONT]
MNATDPTYPLYLIACILASIMLLLVLMTSFIRQSWNLGVAFLCFWLFLELSTESANAIIWSDNADVKFHVYCDIVTHLQGITFVVKPMATLIITRRLYLIASLQSVEIPNKALRRWDIAFEWTLGLVIPMLVAGPVYYVNQGARFLVFEGFGCRTASESSVLETILDQSWSVVPPLISIVFYYPKVVRTYYRQRKDINSFLRSNTSVSRTNYFRILVLASLDIMLTLPIGIVNITLNVVQPLSVDEFPFYPGWTFLHTDWEPVGFSYTELQADGTSELALNYFVQWTSPVLAFVIFSLFGVSPEARASYWRIICTIGKWFGWKPTPRARNGQASLGDIEFGAGPAQDTSGIDLEMGCVRRALLTEASLIFASRSRTPSFINTDVPVTHTGAGHVTSGHTAREEETEMDSKAGEDTTRREYPGDAVPQ